MAKVEYEAWEIKHFKSTEEGRKYLEYNDKVGGEPLGLIIPYGYPEGFDEYGSVIAVYDECIKQNKTWQELLNFNPPSDAIF